MKILLALLLALPFGLQAQVSGGGTTGGTTPPTSLIGSNGVTTTKGSGGKWVIGNTNAVLGGSYINANAGIGTNATSLNTFKISPITGGGDLTISNVMGSSGVLSFNFDGLGFTMDGGALAPNQLFSFTGAPISAPRGIVLSNSVPLNFGVLNGTNGLYFTPPGGTNFWILAP